MKPTLLLALAALPLTACTRTVYQTAPTTQPALTVATTTEAPYVVSQPREREKDYLEAIYENSLGWDVPLTQPMPELVDAGWATCRAIDNGMTREEMLDSMLDASQNNPNTNDLMAAMGAAAVLYLCPEHYDFWR